MNKRIEEKREVKKRIEEEKKRKRNKRREKLQKVYGELTVRSCV